VSHTIWIPIVDEVCGDAFGQAKPIIQTAKEKDATVRALIDPAPVWWTRG